MIKKNVLMLLLTIVLFFIISSSVAAEPAFPVPSIDLNIKAAETPKEVALSLQVLFILTILSLAPALLIMVTSFTRIIIVLSFTRSAVGTQQMPLIKH